MSDLDQRGINIIRGLAMDAVQRANSGHPGTPMALAPLAHVLFTRVMRYDAADPDWFDRDRFVLSNGHTSMLLYSMLYLTGFGLDLDDLRAFRQWGSRTPGHPEYRHAPGIEVTTGPLGQGFANSVGMALAEANLRERYGPEVCDHHTFVIAGDGCFEEGVSHEAASLAGHLGLGRLLCVYDDNHITIDGPTELAYSDDVGRRFEAYGWQVVHLGEVANDLDAIEGGLRDGMRDPERPTVVILRSHIGWPSPKYTDTAFAHGNALGEDEVRAVKVILDLPPDETFFVPDDVLAQYREAGRRGEAEHRAWDERHARLRTAEPQMADEFDACLAQRGLPGWEAKLPTFQAGESIATPRCEQEGARRHPRCGAQHRHRRGRPVGQHRHRAGQHAGDRHPSVQGPPGAFRDPRVRDGRRAERHGRLRAAPRGRDVLRVLRLHAGHGAPRGAVQLQDRVRLDARLGRARRGRPDAPADRAARLVPRDAEHAGHPPGRRERGGAGLADPRGQRRRPDRADPHPSEDPGPRGHGRAGTRGRRARRVHARRRGHRRAPISSWSAPGPRSPCASPPATTS